MTLEDMIDLVTMYEARVKGLEVYKILFDKPKCITTCINGQRGRIWSVHEAGKHYSKT